MTALATTNEPIVSYGITDSDVAELATKYAGLKADTPDGYKAVSAALKEVVSTRTTVENARKELKAQSLEWGRKVDAEAKRLTASILVIEGPLRAAKDSVDNERQRKLDEIKADEDRRIAEAEQRRKDEEEAKQRKAREEEAERNRVERERLAKERAELQAERDKQAKEQQAAQAKIDAERAELRRQQAVEEQRRLARVQAERDQAEKERREKMVSEMQERNRIEGEKQKALKIEQDRADAERLAAIKPDAEKLHAWSRSLVKFVSDTQPKLTTESGESAFMVAVQMIDEAVVFLEAFGGNTKCNG